MLRTMLKLAALATLIAILVIGSWDLGNFGLSGSVSSPAPPISIAQESVSYTLNRNPAPAFSLVELLLGPDSFYVFSPMLEGDTLRRALSVFDVAVLFSVPFVLVLALNRWNRSEKKQVKRIRRVVSRYGTMYIRQGLAAHKARNRL